MPQGVANDGAAKGTHRHRTGASKVRAISVVTNSPCSTAQRGAPRQDGERSVEQQIFRARHVNDTRHRFDVTFVAGGAVYSARVAVVHRAGEVWRGGRLASDSAAQEERSVFNFTGPVERAILTTCQEPSPDSVRSPAHVCLLPCLPCHALAHCRPVPTACHRCNSIEAGGAEPAQVAYGS